MPVPTSPLFERFIGESRLVRDLPKGPHIEFSRLSLSPEVQKARQLPNLYLSYPDMELKLESVLGVIQRELVANSSRADRDISIALLGIIGETRSPSDSAVEHANRCLSNVIHANLHLSIVLPHTVRPSYNVQLGDICFRSFDPQQFLYWSKKGKCGYPIELSALRGRFSVNRNNIALKIVNLDLIQGGEHVLRRWGQEIATALIWDQYYQAIFRSAAMEIPRLLREALLILEAGALVHVDDESLLSLPLNNQIGLFTWQNAQGPRGWALLAEQTGLNLNTPPEDTVNKCREWLLKVMRHRELCPTKHLDNSIRNYARFMQLAQHHRLNKRANEAFLHFVIALDLLFGTDGRLGDSVSLRSAALIHRQMRATFSDQTDKLKELYRKRSKYVHEGVHVAAKDVREIEQICLAVLWSLLSVSAQDIYQSILEWLQQVDFAAAAFNANRPISENDLAKIGIPGINEYPIPPNHVD